MTVPPRLEPAAERAFMSELVARIVRECPRRMPTSEDERRAHRILLDELEKAGLTAHLESFEFNASLYANLALHFGIGTLGTVVSGVSPLAGLILHLTAGTSYLLDNTRRAFWLRRVFPHRPSQNVLGVLGAKNGAAPRLRVVFAAHADAAYTGFIFHPTVVKIATGDRADKPAPLGLTFLKHPLAIATFSNFALAGFDLLRLAFGRIATAPLRPIEYLLTIPNFLSFALNLEIVLRDEIVAGANDNLSGCAALVPLALRLAADKPDDVEYVFVATGCEEASLGGAEALARTKHAEWDRRTTVIVGIDSLTNGDLRWFHEGDVIAHPPVAWLEDALNAATKRDTRFANIRPFSIPAGASDAYAFLRHGWDAVCIGAVDPTIGSPRHYHQPTDTPENFEVNGMTPALDFIEAVTREILAHRAV